jgi:hypothetical protein
MSWSTLILALGWATAARADKAFVGAVERQDLFGTLNQLALPGVCNDDPTSACGPAATINSFIWLQNAYPLIYDDKLVPFGQERQTALTLAEMMSCVACVGTTAPNLLAGKRAYIDGGKDAAGIERTGVLPGTTTFGIQIRRRDNALASLAFLYDQIKEGEDVEMLVGFYSARSGTLRQIGAHWVTANGISFNDNNDDGKVDAGDAPRSIDFIDPLGKDKTEIFGAQKLSDLELNLEDTELGQFLEIPDFFSVEDNPEWGTLNDGNTFVGVLNLVAESPKPASVPEPTSGAVLILALAGTVIVRINRATRPCA